MPLLKTAIRYIAQREQFEIRAGVNADEYLRRLRDAVASTFDIFAPKIEQPLRGKIQGNEFQGTMRFPYTFDYHATVIARVEPSDSGCTVHVVVSGGWWASYLMFLVLAWMLGVVIYKLVNEGWTRESALFMGFLVFVGITALWSGRNILIVRRAAEDIFGAIAFREPRS